MTELDSCLVLEVEGHNWWLTTENLEDDIAICQIALVVVMCYQTGAKNPPIKSSTAPGRGSSLSVLCLSTRELA